VNSGNDCRHEARIVEMIVADRWPSGCDRELADHIAECSVCREVVDLALALHGEEAIGRQEARTRVPSAAIVWWRATVRARAEASRVAERPITVAQSVAGACAVGLACGVVGAAWRSLEWFRRIGDIVAALAPSRVDVQTASMLILQHALPLVLGVGACLVIAPLALYLVLSDD